MSKNSDTDLTAREAEVLSQLRLGGTNAQIGGALQLAEKTIKAHLTSIYRKLGVTNRVQAALTPPRKAAS